MSNAGGSDVCKEIAAADPFNFVPNHFGRHATVLDISFLPVIVRLPDNK
jgi:hypothetical protein